MPKQEDIPPAQILSNEAFRSLSSHFTDAMDEGDDAPAWFQRVGGTKAAAEALAQAIKAAVAHSATLPPAASTLRAAEGRTPLPAPGAPLAALSKPEPEITPAAATHRPPKAATSFILSSVRMQDVMAAAPETVLSLRGQNSMISLPEEAGPSVLAAMPPDPITGEMVAEGHDPYHSAAERRQRQESNAQSLGGFTEYPSRNPSEMMVEDSTEGGFGAAPQSPAATVPGRTSAGAVPHRQSQSPTPRPGSHNDLARAAMMNSALDSALANGDDEGDRSAPGGGPSGSVSGRRIGSGRRSFPGDRPASVALRSSNASRADETELERDIEDLKHRASSPSGNLSPQPMHAVAENSREGLATPEPSRFVRESDSGAAEEEAAPMAPALASVMESDDEQVRKRRVLLSLGRDLRCFILCWVEY